MDLFSFVTGAGRDGDGGVEIAYSFSCKVSQVDPVGVELLEEVEEIDKLVFRRSRIFINDCIRLQTQR